MSEERRHQPRYKTLRIPVTIDNPVRANADSYLVDVSRSGAFLKDCRTAADDTVVSISPHRRPALERTCSIKRQGTAGNEWCAIEFTKLLSDLDIARLTMETIPPKLAGTTDRLELARADRDRVQGEVGEIKACHSNIFLWTSGAVATATLAVWAFFLDGKLTLPGVMAAMTVVLATLYVGMLAIAEKLRAIRLREGFVQALDLYLAQGIAPREYPGWTTLRTHFSECGAVRRLDKCSRRIPIKGGLSCRDEGEMKASQLNSAKHLYPSAMSSFMSLSASILVLAYLTVVSLFAFSLASIWRTRPGLNLSLQSLLIPFAFGFVLGTPMVRFKPLVMGMVFGFAISLVIGVVAAGSIWAQISCFALGTVLGAFGWFFLRDLRDICVGRFSSNTLTYTWEVILMHCRPRTQSKNEAPFYKSPKWYVHLLERCFLWMIHRESHERTYRRYSILAKAPYDTRPSAEVSMSD